jgi:hypothetical protein
MSCSTLDGSQDVGVFLLEGRCLYAQKPNATRDAASARERAFDSAIGCILIT